MSETFKPGQTVWYIKDRKLAGNTIADHNGTLWLEQPTGGSYFAPSADFTITDPNAEPEPIRTPSPREFFQRIKDITMTLEDRLNELETAIQTLRRDMQAKPEHKFKVGDAVYIIGTVDRIDDSDGEGMPYLVSFGRDPDKDVQWFPEADLTKAP